VENPFDFIPPQFKDALEIIILSVLIYYTLLFIRGTRGAKVLTGSLMLLIVLALLSNLLQLHTIQWLLGRFFPIFAIALLVIFQPELRRGLAHLGSWPLFQGKSREREMIDIITEIASSLSARKYGALIAIEREVALRGITEAGVGINGRLSSEILEQIFYPNSPLHDGGVIVHQDRVVAAACIFPLSQRLDLHRSLGTRHRAAIGMTEESDAIVVVVSEETGQLSLAQDGRLIQKLEIGQLREKLTAIFLDSGQTGLASRLRNWLNSRTDDEEDEKVFYP
jgi:diadenylate cyclase